MRSSNGEKTETLMARYQHFESMTTWCYEKADGRAVWFSTAIVGLTTWLLSGEDAARGPGAWAVAVFGLYAAGFVLHHHVGGRIAHRIAVRSDHAGVYDDEERQNAEYLGKGEGLWYTYVGLLVLAVCCAFAVGGCKALLAALVVAGLGYWNVYRKVLRDDQETKKREAEEADRGTT